MVELNRTVRTVDGHLSKFKGFDLYLLLVFKIPLNIAIIFVDE